MPVNIQNLKATTPLMPVDLQHFNATTPLISSTFDNIQYLWTPIKYRRRVLTMPIGLRFKCKSIEICIAFGLLQCAGARRQVRLIYAAGIRTGWQWNGWNLVWRLISGRYIRIYTQWDEPVAHIPIDWFVESAFIMTNKSITWPYTGPYVVQSGDPTGWVML